ncbi:AAEL003463-PA [Aedes aegypti]|uniref:AAEL003463-PA n=1 Tax=Aedes aegypti TaxID=7159 RepID=Q17F88_AEDAE|nr:AAEL003463-PA [Aedes aegypti]
MYCTFCKEGAAQLTPHHLCSSCLVHLEDCSHSNQVGQQTTGMVIIPKKEPIQEAECDACSGRFPEDDLPEHRAKCSTRLVFRCGLCNASYLSMEALWNHLDSHEEANGSKDSYCSEEKVSYRLHLCALCNDQRGYQDDDYWEHIHEDHDGFYLKCSECGDHFRSKKLQTDHALNQCKSRRTTDVPDLLVKQEFISLDLPMHVDRFDDCSGSNEESPNNPEEEPEGDNMEVEEKTMAELPSKAIADTKCPHCAKELHRAAALAVHVKDCHTPTKCDQCDLVFEGRSRMSYHKSKTHRTPKYVCPHCPKTFHLKSTYQPHLQAHLKADSYPCDICEKQCKDLRYLAQHYRRYHFPYAHFQKLFAALKAREQGDNTAMDEFKVENGAILKEQIKEEDTESESDGEQVSASDHKITCNSNLQDITDGKPCSTVGSISIKPPDDLKTSKPVVLKPIGTVCPYCDKDFKNTKIVTGHIECCHEPIVCDVCGITSHGTTEARDHKTKIHAQKLFECVHCPKKLQSKTFYIVHLTKHLNDRKFSCQTCGHRYNKLDNLISHSSNFHKIANAWVKVHSTFKDCYLQDPELAFKHGLQKDHIALITGEPTTEQPLLDESYQPSTDKLIQSIDPMQSNSPLATSSKKSAKTEPRCPHCDKTYSNRWRLQSHIDERHGPATSDTSKTALKCSHCTRVFYANWRLNAHFTECHREVQCEICGESFAGKVQARYHQKKSHTDPQLQCPHCEDKFHLKVQLTRHLTKHVQDRNFPCEICNARFKDQHYLNNHIQRMHYWNEPTSAGDEGTSNVESLDKEAQSSQIEFVSIKQEMDES